MARIRTVHRCRDCGATSPRWEGRCAACGAWNTLVEEAAGASAGRSGPGGDRTNRWAGVRPAPGAQPVSGESAGFPSGATAGPAVALGAVDAGGATPLPTGVEELDRALGGGLVPGSVTLLGGEPGIGKSTLVLQAAAGLAGRGRTVLLVSAEESAAQVRRRADRLGATVPGVWLASETSLVAIAEAVTRVGPDVLVVDSIQTVVDPDIESGAGSTAQVRGCALELAALAKAAGLAVVLVGHVTKDGAIAGPRTLEHLVDTVLSFEGDRHHALRLLRLLKHRHGSTGELGLFEMAGTGLVGVADPAAMLLGDRQPGAPGSVVFPALDGRRPLLVEIQALVADGAAGGHRAASGIPAGRLAPLLAVIDRRAGIALGRHDVYVSVVGGVRIDDPGADLAVVLAIVSAATSRPLHPDLVAVGEVGLGGEIRQAGDLQRRLTEAARSGFRRALVPPGAAGSSPAVRLEEVATVGHALEHGLAGQVARPPLRLVDRPDRASAAGSNTRSAGLAPPSVR